MVHERYARGRVVSLIWTIWTIYFAGNDSNKRHMVLERIGDLGKRAVRWSMMVQMVRQLIITDKNRNQNDKCIGSSRLDQ